MHPATTAVRSIRNDRAPEIELAVSDPVRRSETVRDGSELDPAPNMPTAETMVIDPKSGRFLELTARQMTAIHLLLMGKSVVATAESLGIGVSTLHRWKSKHPAFIAELNRRKLEVFERTIDKLRSTMAKAVDELHAMMTSRNARDRYAVAIKLLPLLGPRKWIEPTGPTDPAAVVDEKVRERRSSRGEEATAEVTEVERDAVIGEAEIQSPLPVSRERVRVSSRASEDSDEPADDRAEEPSPRPSPGVPGEGESGSPPSRDDSSRLESCPPEVLRCAQGDSESAPQDDKPDEPDALRNVRTHADEAGMRPGESSDSGGRSVTGSSITA